MYLEVGKLGFWDEKRIKFGYWQEESNGEEVRSIKALLEISSSNCLDVNGMVQRETD